MNDEMTIYAKTVYAEARDESPRGQEWIAWVIKNRAVKGWGGGSIKGVCLEPYQFQCWNGCNDVKIQNYDRHIYDSIRTMCSRVKTSPLSNDPTGGCDHYYAVVRAPKPPKWTNTAEFVAEVEGFRFYKQN